MTNTKELILQLKEVRQEKQLSYNDILEIMEKNGDFLAKSTLSRVFAEGSENERFMYETTIRPIANALLDIETLEETDTIDEKAMKALLRYKIQRIEELEQQINYKDTRMDMLLGWVDEKDTQNKEMLEKVLKCSKCPVGVKDED